MHIINITHPSVLNIILCCFLSAMAGCMTTRKIMFSQQKCNGSEGCIVAFNRAGPPKASQSLWHFSLLAACFVWNNLDRINQDFRQQLQAPSWKRSKPQQNHLHQSSRRIVLPNAHLVHHEPLEWSNHWLRLSKRSARDSHDFNFARVDV